MDFEKLTMIFTMQEPYYGILLSAMERVSCDKVSTLGVGQSGNVIRLYYNPRFTDSLTVDAATEVIKHEMLHTALGHLTLFEGNNVSPEVHRLRNIALDMEVNGYLDIDKIRDLEPVLASDKGWDNFLGGREYYKRLLQKAQQMQQQKQAAKSPQKQCDGGKGGKDEEEEETTSSSGQEKEKDSQDQISQQTASETSITEDEDVDSSGSSVSIEDIPQEMLDQYKEFDDHSTWDECTEISKDQFEQIVEDLVVFAAEEVEKAHGKIPSEMVGRVEGLKKKKPKPVADWKRYFRRYLGNEFTELIRKSKKRESRRFPDAAGNRHKRKSHILVAIDTSGSVSMPEYREFFGQIKTLTASATFHVVECDADIQYEYDYKGKPNEKLYGGGGTSFKPAIDLFNKNRKHYDALVYFTDGYCEIPNDTPKDTLWVISSNGDQSDRNRYRINGASVAFIPKRNAV